jgi:hypothetical protein
LTAVVVFPTPPFSFAIVMVIAMPPFLFSGQFEDFCDNWPFSAELC